eukprot:2271772-Lingulodinium_polyedra.AAC.1
MEATFAVETIRRGPAKFAGSAKLVALAEMVVAGPINGCAIYAKLGGNALPAANPLSNNMSCCRWLSAQTRLESTGH